MLWDFTAISCFDDTRLKWVLHLRASELGMRVGVLNFVVHGANGLARGLNVKMGAIGR